jgi:hypothetical protein
MLRFVVTVLLACGWAGWAGLAAAQEPPADPVRAALASWGCEPLSLVEVGTRWYAACGGQGVFVVEHREEGLVLAERRTGAGQARGVFVRDAQVWVESTRVEARPVADLALASSAGASVPPPPVAAPMAAPPPAPRLPPPILHPIEPPPIPRESKLFPSRRGGLLLLEGSARPLLPIDTRAFAGMADVALSYIGERHWFAELRGFPLGGIVGEGRDTPLMGAIAQAGYDHPYFALGLGAGALLRGAWSEEWQQQGNVYVTRASQSTHFAISQYARLGARDGLNLSVQSVFVLVDDWKFGFVEVRSQIPLTRGTWLVPAGAGGEQAGFFYTELGLRRLMRGDGGSGSLYVRPSVGAAGVDKRDGWNSMRIGPMIGFHLEYRN